MKTLRELQSLKGRVAVITGGAGKIGEAFAEALGELGATICIFDVAEEAANQRASQIGERFAVQASAFVVDVSREDSVQDGRFISGRPIWRHRHSDQQRRLSQAGST